MRLLEKNKQNLKYALQVGEVPVYERDEDGNIIYIEIDGQKVPVETGDGNRLFKTSRFPRKYRNVWR